jgi:hypothetical protein
VSRARVLYPYPILPLLGTLKGKWRSPKNTDVWNINRFVDVKSQMTHSMGEVTTVYTHGFVSVQGFGLEYFE